MARRRSASLVLGVPVAATALLACGGHATGDREPRTPGRLEPILIQRTVRASFDRLRRCYDAGLARNRDLEGRIATKFVIERDGSVSSSEAVPGYTDLADATVVVCVVDAFREIRFPRPDGGIVTVVYPIVFEPGR